MTQRITIRGLAMILMIVAALLIAMSVVVLTDDSAKADETTVCVPTPEIPAVPGTPEIPAVPGTPEVPAVTEVIHHDAVYATEYHFRKFTSTREGVKQGNTIVWGPWGPWSPWEPEQHTSWEDSTDPIGIPQPHGSGHTGKNYWERVWQPMFDGKTRQGELISEAYDETIVVTPSIPAVPGTPSIPAVPGTPAVPAVSCPEPPVVVVPPSVVETPVVVPPVVVPPSVVETPTPIDDGGVIVICGIEIVPPKPGEPTRRDILCPIPTPEKDDKPQPRDDSSSTMACVNGVWVTTVNGKVVSSSGTCGKDNDTVVPLEEVKEEGM